MGNNTQKYQEIDNNIRITKDGFVWRTLSYKEPKALWDTEIFELYKLYDDDTEDLIQDDKDF